MTDTFVEVSDALNAQLDLLDGVLEEPVVGELAEVTPDAPDDVEDLHKQIVYLSQQLEKKTEEYDRLVEVKVEYERIIRQQMGMLDHLAKRCQQYGISLRDDD